MFTLYRPPSRKLIIFAFCDVQVSQAKICLREAPDGFTSLHGEGPIWSFTTDNEVLKPTHSFTQMISLDVKPGYWLQGIKCVRVKRTKMGLEHVKNTWKHLLSCIDQRNGWPCKQFSVLSKGVVWASHHCSEIHNILIDTSPERLKERALKLGDKTAQHGLALDILQD